MVSNEIEQMNFSGLTIENIKNFEEKDLDRLLENIQSRIAKNRMQIEQCLEEF